MNQSEELVLAEHIDLERSSFDGNPRLRPAGIPVRLTPSQMEEYVKCSEDPIYFIENYIKIINLDEGLVPFKPWKYQKKMIKQFIRGRFSIVKAPRQCGKSTSVSGFIIWSIIFQPSYAIGLMANKMENAQELLGRVRLAYENLPKWIQQGVVTWNLRSIALENNSSVFASATTAGGLRSKSLNCVVLDEFAHVPYNIQTKFFTSTYPVITSGTKTKVIIISTPNGMELFFNLWKGAITKKNAYKPIDIHWSETPGRDEKWKEETIKNTSKEQFRQEYDTEFIGSTDTLIDPIVLARLPHIDSLRKSEDIAIYKEPIDNHIYMVVADTARGVGGDYSAFLVIYVTSAPYEVVAQFRENTIKAETYPNYIAHAAKVYNDAYILAEENDIGAQVISILLYDLECENIMQTGSAGRAGIMLNGGNNPKHGIRTTTPVKRIGCFALKSILENDQIILNSEELVNELISFIKAGKSFEAQEGRHDDLVMCLVLFCWATTQIAFLDITEPADSAWKKIQEQKREKHEEDQLLFGIIDEGEIEEEKPFDFTPALSDVIEQAEYQVGNW